jgi:hypothetical protein
VLRAVSVTSKLMSASLIPAVARFAIARSASTALEKTPDTVLVIMNPL